MMTKIEEELARCRERVQELEDAIREITYRDKEGIFNSKKEFVDLGEVAPVLRTIEWK